MSGTFFMMMAAAKKSPYKQELTYLESQTNGCYIDTGIVPTDNTVVKFKYDFVAFGDSAGAIVFGQTAANGTRANMFGCGQVNAIGRITSFFATVGNYRSVGHTNENLIFEHGELSDSNGTVIINRTSGSITTNRTLYLFAENYGGVVYRAGRIKIFYLKIYEGATMVRDFIPVLDNANAYAMYDRVSGNLFYNLGSGTMTGA